MNNLSTRTIDVVTAEIVIIRDNTRKTFFQAVIEIGRRLEEAKEMVQQGEWLDYLQNVLDFKPSTAQNYMRIAREFGDGQVALDGMSASDLFGDLGYSQLVPLLGLPEDDRKQLAQENDLPEMSSREIKKLVEDYKAAQRAEQHAQTKAAEAQETAEKAAAAAGKAEAAAENERAAREAADAKNRELAGQVESLMQQLKEKPIEATAELVLTERNATADADRGTMRAGGEAWPDEELLERAREQVRAETEDAMRAAQERAEAANAALEQAKNPAVHQVNFLFGELRGVSERLDSAFAVLRESQPDTAMKFGAAIGKWLSGAAAEWNL